MADRFELENFLPYRLNRAAEAIALNFSRIYRSRYDMTRPEWRTLVTLGAVGRMTATAIGAHSSMHKTKVSRAIRALEERRWVKRTADADDRRVEHIELTRLGRKAYEDLAHHARIYEGEITVILGRKGLKSLEDGLGSVESAIRGRKLPG